MPESWKSENDRKTEHATPVSGARFNLSPGSFSAFPMFSRTLLCLCQLACPSLSTNLLCASLNLSRIKDTYIAAGPETEKGMVVECRVGGV